MLGMAIAANESGFGYDRSSFMKMARGALAANLGDCEADVDKLITYKWLRGFQERHPTLTFSKLDMRRTRSANPDVFKACFDRLESFIKSSNHGKMCMSYQLYNMDECASAKDVTKDNAKVTDRSKPFHTFSVVATDGKEDEQITGVYTTRADGAFVVPPYVIYQGTKLTEDTTRNIPDEWGVNVSLGGSMTLDIFPNWLV